MDLYEMLPLLRQVTRCLMDSSYSGKSLSSWRVNRGLDKVEDKMAIAGKSQDLLELSTSKYSTPSSSSSVRIIKSKRKVQISIDSSSDSDFPTLEVLRSPQLQRKVDKHTKELEHSSQCSCGDNACKHKSKRGGNIEVSVKTKVAWPHETILGGANRQRINYDQLSLTQWVHGFCKNIFDEPSEKRRNVMVVFMGELMEDATDFFWQRAKAAHAIWLCEMERGKVTWEDQGCIDRIRRVRITQVGQNWVNMPEHPGFTKTSKLACVLLSKIMRQMVSCTVIFVHFVFLMVSSCNMQKKDCIHKKIVNRAGSCTKHQVENNRLTTCKSIVVTFVTMTVDQ